MSAYTKNIENNIERTLAAFRSKIIRTEQPTNTQGYGYLSSGRKNIHRLNDGTYISEGLSFSAAKAASVGYFYHYAEDDSLIKSYKV